MAKVNWAAKKKTGSRLDSPCGASRIGHSTPNLPRVESSSTIRKKQYHVETVKPASMCDSMRVRIALHVFSGSQVSPQNFPLDSSSETGSREYSLTPYPVRPRRRSIACLLQKRVLVLLAKSRQCVDIGNRHKDWWLIADEAPSAGASLDGEPLGGGAVPRLSAQSSLLQRTSRRTDSLFCLPKTRLRSDFHWFV